VASAWRGIKGRQDWQTETGSHWPDGVDGSTRTASQCAMLVLYLTNREKEPSTMTITTLGIDLAKSVFQLHGIDTNGGH
jgi:uncharacterized protein YeaC (DUF1315 family)